MGQLEAVGSVIVCRAWRFAAKKGLGRREVHPRSLFSVLNLKDARSQGVFAKKSGLPVARLRYFNDACIFPTGSDLDAILRASGMEEMELRLRLGAIDGELARAIASNATAIAHELGPVWNGKRVAPAALPPHAIETGLGRLYQADCIDLMRAMPDGEVDLVFADPPFNLDKEYESGVDDNRQISAYLDWTEEWILEAVRLLTEGGAIFVWNLPRWNVHIASILSRYLTFRHWIAVDIKYRLPIKGRLYPSHYSLLYFIKGPQPATFNNQRIPLEVCRHCGGDIRDYGGYKDKLNPDGINVTDVWYDIPPVRHTRYKTRSSNELSLKLLERVISVASNEGDLVFDPFGGSGTTYIAAELMRRRWIGAEIGPVDSIVERFNRLPEQAAQLQKIQGTKNTLFTEEIRALRMQNGHWVPETLRARKSPTDRRDDQPRLLEPSSSDPD